MRSNLLIKNFIDATNYLILKKKFIILKKKYLVRKEMFMSQELYDSNADLVVAI